MGRDLTRICNTTLHAEIFEEDCICRELSITESNMLLSFLINDWSRLWFIIQHMYVILLYLSHQF